MQTRLKNCSHVVQKKEKKKIEKQKKKEIKEDKDNAEAVLNHLSIIITSC